MEQQFELRNIETGKKLLCEKVIITDDNDNQNEYYVDDWIDTGIDVIYNKKIYSTVYSDTVPQGEILLSGFGYVMKTDCKRIIATNDERSYLSQVVNEAQYKSEQFVKEKLKESSQACGVLVGFIEGYNNRAETHPNSDEDMIDFGRFCAKFVFSDENTEDKSPTELLEIWKSQQLPVIYFRENHF